MGIFHKLKVGLGRIFNSSSVAYTPEVKRYGNAVEFGLPSFLKSRIPSCQVKSNVLISLPNENAQAEIDCLILLEDKLFAIEIKHWKGSVVERSDGFHIYKQDKYTDDVWEKVLKSPFRQVGRAVSMLKKQTNNRDWIQTIVYFEGASSVQVLGDDVWFDDAGEIVDYIINYQNRHRSNGNIQCFRSAIAADFIYSGTYRNLHCIIDDKSLCFDIEGRVLTRQDICWIDIGHHFSYDNLHIHLCNGNAVTTQVENGRICAIENNIRREYSLCKIDRIILG